MRFVALALLVCTSCVRSQGVVRSSAAGPRPLVVAILPFARDPFALPSPVRTGCTEGVESKDVKIVSNGAIDAELAGRHVKDIDDRTAVMIGKQFDADVVIVGSFSVGHFASAVEARLVRTATAETEATAYYEGESTGRDAAKRSCAALIP